MVIDVLLPFQFLTWLFCLKSFLFIFLFLLYLNWKLLHVHYHLCPFSVFALFFILTYPTHGHSSIYFSLVYLAQWIIKSTFLSYLWGISDSKFLSIFMRLCIIKHFLDVREFAIFLSLERGLISGKIN